MKKFWYVLIVLAPVVIIGAWFGYRSIVQRRALQQWLAQPVAGRASVGTGTPGGDLEQCMTVDLPAWKDLSQRIGERLEEPPAPPAAQGKFYYNGSWRQLRRRLEAPTPTRRLVFIEILAAFSPARKGVLQLQPEDVIAEASPGPRTIVVNVKKAGYWPVGYNPVAVYADTGGSNLRNVGLVAGSIGAMSWQFGAEQYGWKGSGPVTMADFGELVKVTDLNGQALWPPPVERKTLPHGATEFSGKVEGVKVRCVRGRTGDERPYEAWRSAAFPDYELMAIYTPGQPSGGGAAADQGPAVVLLAGPGKRLIAARRHVPAGNTGSTSPWQWRRWYLDSGPVLEGVDAWEKTVEDVQGLLLSIDANAKVLDARIPDGQLLTVEDALGADSVWKQKRGLYLTAANEREQQWLRAFQEEKQ